ncbi:MAG: hypothetical protein M3Q56_06715 [Bacteroidota bacterium]|nr:hypothetical protein [Bacteroidota bacterium]
MSKDKGTKNIKKLPADKSSGKGKVISSYKSETKSGQSIETFVQKPDSKTGKSKKA